MSTARKERIARNESAFRALNESLEASVHRGRPSHELVGFVCECGDPDCDATVRLGLPAYESIRRDAQLFVALPGHEAFDAENVIDEHDGYIVLRKHDEVAHLVKQTDTRGERSE